MLAWRISRYDLQDYDKCVVATLGESAVFKQFVRTGDPQVRLKVIITMPGGKEIISAELDYPKWLPPAKLEAEARRILPRYRDRAIARLASQISTLRAGLEFVINDRELWEDL